MFNILVAEDDKNTRKLMSAILKNNGYDVYTAVDGIDALDVLDKQHIDLIIVDVMMPKMNGFEMTQIIRKSGSTIPMLIVSAKQSKQDKHYGFIVGIDDYMTKPVDEDEMLLRIKALLRRSQIVYEQKLIIGNITLDYNNLTIIKNNESVILPKKEFYLLYKLLSYPDHIFTRFQLMEEIWGMDTETDEHTVDVHINRLRSKLIDISEFEILTIRGLGYKAVKNI